MCNGDALNNQKMRIFSVEVGPKIDFCIRVVVFLMLVFAANYQFFNVEILRTQPLPQINNISCYAQEVDHLPFLKGCRDYVETADEVGEEDRDRRRLSYGAIFEREPELFERVILVVDRADDLEKTQARNAEWARRQLNVVNLTILAVGLFYVMFLSRPSPQPTGGAVVGNLQRIIRLAPNPVLLVLVIATALNSLSFHSKYAAFLNARADYASITTEVDAESHLFALELQAVRDELSGTDRDEAIAEIISEVDLKVLDWSERIGQTQRDAAEEFGEGLTSFTLPISAAN